MYVSVAELVTAIGSKELSDLATPDGRRAVPVDKLTSFLASTLPAGDPDYADCQAIVASATQALVDCASYVDGFLGRYTPLPIADAYVPAIVKRIVVDLARYALAKDAPEAAVIQRYKDARADLLAIADGSLQLSFPTGSTTTLTGDVAAVTPGDCAIYTRASTRRYQNPNGLLP